MSKAVTHSPLFCMFGLFLWASVTSASDRPSDICGTLAKGLKQDRMKYSDSRSQFSDMQAYIRQSEFSDYSSAKNFEGSLGIPITEYVTAALGVKDTSEEWKKNRESFENLTYDSVSSTFFSSHLEEKTSAAAIAEISKCAVDLAALENTGVFTTLDQVLPEMNAFSVGMIRRSGTGESHWLLAGYTARPQHAVSNCTVSGAGFGQMSLSESSGPVKMDGSGSISCDKDPHQDVVFTVNTSEGSPQSFAIPSVERRLSSIEARLAGLESQVVPPGTIAYFKEDSCPSGWQPARELTGLYVVGSGLPNSVGTVVGIPLGDQENRPTGPHTHVFDPIIGVIRGGDHHNGAQSGSDDVTHPIQVISETGAVKGIDSSKGGTNAPYIQLLACRKLPPVPMSATGHTLNQDRKDEHESSKYGLVVSIVLACSLVAALVWIALSRRRPVS